VTLKEVYKNGNYIRREEWTSWWECVEESYGKAAISEDDTWPPRSKNKIPIDDAIADDWQVKEIEGIE